MNVIEVRDFLTEMIEKNQGFAPVIFFDHDCEMTVEGIHCRNEWLRSAFRHKLNLNV